MLENQEGSQIIPETEQLETPAKVYSDVDKKIAAGKLIGIAGRSYSTEIIKYDEPGSFGKPRFSKEVLDLLEVLGEKMDENIPKDKEPEALQELARIAVKHSR